MTSDKHGLCVPIRPSGKLPQSYRVPTAEAAEGVPAPEGGGGYKDIPSHRTFSRILPSSPVNTGNRRERRNLLGVRLPCEGPVLVNAPGQRRRAAKVQPDEGAEPAARLPVEGAVGLRHGGHPRAGGGPGGRHRVLGRRRQPPVRSRCRGPCLEGGERGGHLTGVPNVSSECAVFYCLR